MLIVLHFLSTHDDGISGATYETFKTGNILGKVVLLAELPAIRRCDRCKRGFRGACTSSRMLIAKPHRRRHRRGNPVHIFFYSRVNNDPFYKERAIVPLSSFVLIRSLRFTPQRDEDVASTHQWRVDVYISNYSCSIWGGFVRRNCNYDKQTLFKDFGARWASAIRNHIYDFFFLNEFRCMELPPRSLVRFYAFLKWT